MMLVKWEVVQSLRVAARLSAAVCVALLCCETAANPWVVRMGVRLQG